MGALPLLLMAQTVGLHLSAATDLPQDEAAKIVRTFATAIEARTGQDIRVDDPLWAGCRAGQSCVAEVRVRTRADRLVLVEVIAGLTLLRVVVVVDDAAPVEADVRRDDPGEDLEALAARLFEAKAIGDVVPPPPPPPPFAATTTAEPSYWPWVALGGAAVALAVGIVFGLSSRSARADSQDPNLTPEAFDVLADRTQTHAIVADVGFVLAAVGAVTTGVLWAVE